MGPKCLVLLVEGYGDVEAAPILVKRLIKEYVAFDAMIPDPDPPLRIGDYSKISKNDFFDWKRYLQNAARRKNCGGCLLLLDGDSKIKVDGQPFCSMRAAQCLAAEAKKVGAGKIFSTAIVFACIEFESWLIAGAESLVGQSFSDSRKEIERINIQIPEDPETAPRNAKGWFRKIMKTGYNPPRDQSELAQLVDINTIRSKKMRSFRRLESALQELVNAIRSGNHTVTPTC